MQLGPREDEVGAEPPGRIFRRPSSETLASLSDFTGTSKKTGWEAFFRFKDVGRHTQTCQRKATAATVAVEGPINLFDLAAGHLPHFAQLDSEAMCAKIMQRSELY